MGGIGNTGGLSQSQYMVRADLRSTTDARKTREAREAQETTAPRLPLTEVRKSAAAHLADLNGKPTRAALIKGSDGEVVAIRDGSLSSGRSYGRY